MGKRIREYPARIDRILEQGGLTGEEWAALRKEHLQQLAFFQHERLVHLIVTVTVAVLAFLALGFGVQACSMGFLLAAALLIILFIPYILHYRLLENGVQKMYGQYDRITEKISADGEKNRAE